MKTYPLVLVTVSLSLGGAALAALETTTKPEVEKSGQTSKIAFEHVVDGHLKDLNGRYKLRVTETVYAPGGHIGPHHHSGPGIRLVQSGELTYVQEGRTTIYKPGDYFFESGSVTHTAYNRTHAEVRILNFEILPVEWSGPSPIPVPSGLNSR